MEVVGQSQQADPKSWQGRPVKGSHSVVMSQDWHPSSNRAAESGFTGKSERGGNKRKCKKEEESREESNEGGWGRRRGKEEPVFQARGN